VRKDLPVGNIKEFADYGKSGLSAEHRDDFNDMLENWVAKTDS
jgi:hypothetical protein